MNEPNIATNFIDQHFPLQYCISFHTIESPFTLLSMDDVWHLYTLEAGWQEPIKQG